MNWIHLKNKNPFGEQILKTRVRQVCTQNLTNCANPPKYYQFLLNCFFFPTFQANLSIFFHRYIWQLSISVTFRNPSNCAVQHLLVTCIASICFIVICNAIGVISNVILLFFLFIQWFSAVEKLSYKKQWYLFSGENQRRCGFEESLTRFWARRKSLNLVKISM